MSMTHIAFLRKVDIPSNEQIQDTIQKLGYDFKILSGLEKQIDLDGLECSINGHQTYFETYVDIVDHAIDDNQADWVKKDITNQDIAISFVWGSDFAAGACIGLISIALMDLSNALVYYIDDQMEYTREMLLADTPQFLEELKKENIRSVSRQVSDKSKPTNTRSKKTLWDSIKSMFK